MPRVQGLESRVEDGGLRGLGSGFGWLDAPAQRLYVPLNLIAARVSLRARESRSTFLRELGLELRVHPKHKPRTSTLDISPNTKPCTLNLYTQLKGEETALKFT